jgi:hypothetical protein
VKRLIWLDNLESHVTIFEIKLIGTIVEIGPPASRKKTVSF